MDKKTNVYAILKIKSSNFKLKNGNIYIIGNNKNHTEPNFLFFDDPSLDCKHAAIDVRKNKIKVMDLQTKNGTFLNSTKLSPFYFNDLKIEDSIKFGNLFGRLEKVAKQENVLPKKSSVKRKLL